MWTIEEALPLIREIQIDIHRWGYHVMLGGSVLNKGKSDKDLDLFFMPLNGNDGERDRLFAYLGNKFGQLNPIRDSPDYTVGDPWHWHDMYYSESKKRIDFFIR